MAKRLAIFYLYHMIDGTAFTAMALSFAGTEQRAHFERMGFRVVGKRMFATYLAKDNTANIFLTVSEQALFCAMDPTNIRPVPNKWGEKGATTFRLDHVARELVLEALLSAYNDVRG
ncbi:MmcQ/YjbR family DNA-binding protein [Parapedobacter sp. 10938]|uniref:MmcQ/YjbR family DNA-binding protein n=1 Tax=Parapedobacter flavus TaxID=3110225 RepID=UPI002DB780C7|nr:MmcQ/YjbR family DNA-binding protein [Parapedobacter sp. 10938]MEC3880069.1 MmcQ/YjbR family DNA-binding protein [Parapedobacter sp. 10938]